MCKEIERKYLINPLYENSVNDIIKGCNGVLIGDHYFNDTTRLRSYNGDYSICVKSLDTLERDEFEYSINEPIDVPKNMLYKVRYFYSYKSQLFEINVYKDIPLILVEIELKDKDSKVVLPHWIGQEVTEDPRYYNRNLFKNSFPV